MRSIHQSTLFVRVRITRALSLNLNNKTALNIFRVVYVNKYENCSDVEKRRQK